MIQFPITFRIPIPIRIISQVPIPYSSPNYLPTPKQISNRFRFGFGPMFGIKSTRALGQAKWYWSTRFELGFTIRMGFGTEFGKTYLPSRVPRPQGTK